MLVWLAEYLVRYETAFNAISYITVRAILALLTALFISLWIGPKVIKRLQILKFGQEVRNDGPESHFAKKGTPTMGGVMILFSIGVSTLLWANLANPYVWICLFVLFGYGAIGFVDDFRKITRKNTDGLIAVSYTHLRYRTCNGGLWLWYYFNAITNCARLCNAR